jgi:hypothetical protein
MLSLKKLAISAIVTFFTVQALESPITVEE